MAKSKTDYRQLKELGDALEKYAVINYFNIVRCSEYQWNLSEPMQNILLSVYPGSGLIYATHLHYSHTGLIDSTGKKYHFHDKSSMEKQLNNIMFAIDKL